MISFRRTRILVLASALAGQGMIVRAQDAVPPPPLPPGEEKPPLRPPQDGGMRRPGSGRGGVLPGSPGIYPRGDREHLDAFKQLSEEERQRIRAAFEKAWTQPDVVEARDRLMKANEEYRETLHRALEAADPGVVKVLEKAKGAMPGGGFPFAGRLPDPKDSEFPKKLVERLREDVQNWVRGEKRDLPVGRAHERVVSSPAVRDLLRELESAQEPQRRLELAGKLREAYFAAWRAEFGQLREGQPRREGPPPGGKPPLPPEKPEPPEAEKK